MASIRKRTWTTKGEEQTAWVVDYKDQSGKRALKTFATKKDAEAWSVSALHEVSQGTHTRASASKTVEETWKLWLEQCEADKLEFGTIKQRRIHLKHHVGPFIGTVKLSDLSTPFIYDFDTKLRQAAVRCHAPQGHHEPENNAHVRPGTRSRCAECRAGRPHQDGRSG